MGKRARLHRQALQAGTAQPVRNGAIGWAMVSFQNGTQRCMPLATAYELVAASRARQAARKSAADAELAAAGKEAQPAPVEARP